MNSFLAEIRPGGSLRINGVSQEVVQINSYRERYEGETTWWYELELRGEDGVSCTLEWEDNSNDLFLYGAPLELEALEINPSMLEQFDKDEEGCFVSDGITYYYEESGEAVCFQNSLPGEPVRDHEGEIFYYWDFGNETGDYSACVEEWSTGYEVFIGIKIDESYVEKV